MSSDVGRSHSVEVSLTGHGTGQAVVQSEAIGGYRAALLQEKVALGL
jgi:hypothetical protein